MDEEGAAASDSDETIIEGSVTDSDQEGEALHWRRLYFDQDTSLRPEFSFHPGTNGMGQGLSSPEIPLGLTLRKDSQEQKNKSDVIPIFSEDTILQRPQDETTQNQVPLQMKNNFPTFTQSFFQSGLPLSHQNSGGPAAENSENLSELQKEIREDRDFPEVSLLLGTALIGSDVEKSLTEPEKILAVLNIFSESEKEVTLTTTFKETKDKESSLETFISALEKLLSPKSNQEERLLEIMNDFEFREFMNLLISSPVSLSVPQSALLVCHGDLPLGTKVNDTLLAELLPAVNTLSEAQVGPICEEKEQSHGPSGGNESLEVKPGATQTNKDCKQIAQTIEDPKPFGLQILSHENVISSEPLNNEGNSNTVKNTSVLKTPCILRRSSRLEKLKADRDAKHIDDTCKMTETILLKTRSCENQINKSSTKNFRIQDSVLMDKGKGKTMHSSRFKSEQIRKNERLLNEKRKMSKLCPATINRRNIFGENLLYMAALRDDVELVRCCIKNGGHVNQRSYAGWTALHEVCVGGFYRTASELLKGGADVNIKGMYQITPLHDAVINGHHKVVELLLLNGADPLLRNENGKCALDEAKDSCMKNLLEKYIHRHKKHLTSARRKNADPARVEDVHQFKKPKFSYNCSCFVCDENSNRQKPEHVTINKGNKGLLINKSDIYEYYQENSNTTEFGKSKNKESTVNQTCSMGHRKGYLYNFRDSRTNVSKSKGKRNLKKHKKSQDSQVDEEYNNLRQTATSSSTTVDKSVTHQQFTVQSLDDFPEESYGLSTQTLSSLKNCLGINNEACSVSKELHTLDLSDSQEIQSLELKSIDQTEVVSSFSLHKETVLPLVTTEDLLDTPQKQCNSHYKSLENSSTYKKSKNLNKQENSFQSFIKDQVVNDDVDFSTSEKTVTSVTQLCYTEGENHSNYQENVINVEEMDSQGSLPSEDHHSQKNELKAGSLTTLSQQEDVHFYDSDSTVISEQHAANCGQYMYETPFDHSHVNPKQTSLPCIRMPSTYEVSKVTSHMEMFKKLQDNDLRGQTPSVNQTDAHNVEKEQDTERNYTVTDPKPSSSNSPFPTTVHSQEIGTTRVGKMRPNLPEHDFLSPNNMDRGLTNISQLHQKEDKETSHKSDEELTSSAKEDERTIRNCKKKKEKMDSEIHVPPKIHEHKKEWNKTGINKRNARGESRLHLASRRGNPCLAQVLIESGADVNLQGCRPLHEAANEGFNDVIVELLKAGTNANCENRDGTLPLHEAVASNRLKAAEILPENRAHHNEKDQKQKTAWDGADDDRKKELLKSGASEADNGDESTSTVPVKIPAVQPKRYQRYGCDADKTVILPSVLHQTKRNESLSVHQTINAILQDIEEKQEHLLEFEIRSPEDAEQYIEKMLVIKEAMDNVLAQQKAERDALAKKYRVSMESFKHGALREQLANLATRQKSLLVVAKKHKQIRLKIQNYKSSTSFSGLSLRKLPSSSHIPNKKKNQELTSLEKSVNSQSDSLSPVNLACKSMKETPLSLEVWNGSQNTNISLDEQEMREELSGNEMNSKQNDNDATLAECLKPTYCHCTEKMEVSTQPVAFVGEAEYSQEGNGLAETTAIWHGVSSPPAATATDTLTFSESTNVLSQNYACPSTVTLDQDLLYCDLKRRHKGTDSQQPLREISESLAHQGIAVLGSDTVHQIDPCLNKTASAVSHASNIHFSSSSGSDQQQQTIKKTAPYTTVPKKKSMQLKDLILLGRIDPGNVLEFKTKETTHKASILLSGKLKVENGQIYQTPVTWLKDLLGSDSHVTWNYAWSNVTYLGKELLKYVSEEASLPLEPNVTPQQQEPCLPGTSSKAVQSIPHYLQTKEILLISEEELLSREIMEKYWKIYANCKDLSF